MKKKQLAIALSVVVGIGVVYAFMRFGFGIELSSFFAADTSVTSPVNKVLPPNYQGSYSIKSICAPVSNTFYWSLQPGAIYNRIERETNGNGAWILIGNFAPAITSFTDTYCANGSTCKYRYRASDTFFSNVATCAPVYTASVLTAVCAPNSNALSWNVQAYANYNRIERETNGNGAWILIGNFAPAITSFTDTYCANGSTCKYRYRASDTFFSNEVRCPIPLP